MSENYIFSYYQQIQDGSVIVGKWVRLAYEMIIKGLEKKAFFYNHKKAQAAILFVENFCHHHEGELAPGKIRLELWQKAFVSVVFGIVDENGLRQFREVVLIMGRKNGKTLLAAAIAAYCTFLDGEYGARIYFAAPKLEQANLCFEAYHQMILQEPELNQMAQKRRTDIYVKEWNATAKPLAFSAQKSDGLNVQLAVLDECASWKGDAGLKFFEVIRSSIGARKQPIILAITTSGYQNDGIYDELVKRGTRVLLGDSREKRLLPLFYMIDDIERWNDINELRKANPNLGTSVPISFLLDEIAVAEGSLSKKGEFITKYACLKQNSSLAFFPAQVVEKASGEPLQLEDYARHYGLIGVDLSQTTDLSAAVLVIEKGGEFYVWAHFWLPAERLEEATQRDGLPYDAYIKRGILSLSGDNFIDYHDVYDWCVELVRVRKIYPLMVGYDRYSANYLIQSLEGFGYKTDSVFQGDNLWPVLQEVEGILKDGKMHIGDNDLLKVHLLNSAVKMSAERGRGKLVKLSPTDHIDGAAALMDAMTVRMAHYDELGQRLKNEGR